MENAWLYEEAQQRLRRTETLLTVGRTVGGTLDLVEATRRVAREIARVFGAERALSRAPITRGGQFDVYDYHLSKAGLKEISAA